MLLGIVMHKCLWYVTLRVPGKYRKLYRKWKKGVLMTFLNWIKSIMGTDVAPKVLRRYKHVRSRRRNSRGCAKYIWRNHGTRVATKVSRRHFVVGDLTMPITFQTPLKRQKNCIRNEPLISQYDSDSFIIGIDNHASKCISKYKEHFISFTSTSNMAKSPAIKDFKGGLTNIEGVGIVRWWLEDDLGRVTQHDIRDVLYVPQAPYSILSPQHWSQQSSHNHTGASSAWCKTTSTDCQLIWNHGKHVKTVELDKFNVAKFRSAPGNTKSVVKCLLLEGQLGLRDLESTEQAQSCKQLIPAAVVCDDNGHGHPGIESRMGQTHIGSGGDIYLTNEDAHHLGNDHNTTCQIQSQGSANGNVHSGNLSLIGRESPRITKEENISDFMRDHPPPVQVIPQEEEETMVALSDQAELIRWHYRLQHLSFSKLAMLARVGLLPSKLGQVRPPSCVHSVYRS